MRRHVYPKPLADEIRHHLHFKVTPRVFRYWRRMARAISCCPDRYSFYNPDHDMFDMHMVDKVMEFLDRCGYDPLLPDDNHLQRAEGLLWQFWRTNVHLERWTHKHVALSLEQQMELHGDNVLQEASDMFGRAPDDIDDELDACYKTATFQALRNEGWPEHKAKAVVMHVFEEYDYETLSEYIELVYHRSVKSATIRKWLSRDLKQVAAKILPRLSGIERPTERMLSHS